MRCRLEQARTRQPGRKASLEENESGHSNWDRLSHSRAAYTAYTCGDSELRAKEDEDMCMRARMLPCDASVTYDNLYNGDREHKNRGRPEGVVDKIIFL